MGVITMTNRFYNNRSMTSSERVRAITARKKAKANKQRIIISVTALTLVVVAAASFMIFGIANKNTKPVSKSDTTAAQTVSTEAAQQPAAQPAAALQQAVAQVTNQTPQSPVYTQPADVQTSDTQTGDHPITSEDRIDNINGERVYIDTKRPAPENSGVPAHYYACGKTSYGFDWNYDTDNSNFVIRCDYNFDQQQYDFSFYGVTPGTAHVTLYYNTSDKVQIPVQLTVNVDDGLNVSIA